MDTLLQSVSWGDLDLQKFFLASAVIAVSVVIIAFYKLNSRGKADSNLRLLPGPRPWPVIGNLGLLGLWLTRTLRTLRRSMDPSFACAWVRLKLSSFRPPRWPKRFSKLTTTCSPQGRHTLRAQSWPTTDKTGGQRPMDPTCATSKRSSLKNC